jgi:hypothetical protein
MEFPAYLGIMVLCALLLVWSATMDARKPGEPLKGLFRYREPAKPEEPPASPKQGALARRDIVPAANPGTWRGGR